MPFSLYDNKTTPNLIDVLILFLFIVSSNLEEIFFRVLNLKQQAPMDGLQSSVDCVKLYA